MVDEAPRDRLVAKSLHRTRIPRFALQKLHHQGFHRVLATRQKDHTDTASTEAVAKHVVLEAGHGTEVEQPSCRTRVVVLVVFRET